MKYLVAKRGTEIGMASYSIDRGKVEIREPESMAVTQEDLRLYEKQFLFMSYIFDEESESYTLTTYFKVDDGAFLKLIHFDSDAFREIQEFDSVRFINSLDDERMN